MADPWDAFPRADAAVNATPDPWDAFPRAEGTPEQAAAADPRMASADPLDRLAALRGTPSPPPAPAAGAPPAPPQGLVDTIMGLGAQGARGARRGLANLAGLPVDAVNAAPMLANLIPGVSGVGPISRDPVGGSDHLDRLLGGFGLLPEPAAPRSMSERMARRVGEEVGAAALPASAALGTAARVGVQGARELPALARYFVEPAAIAPGRYLGGEAAAGVAAGTGAGAVNEVMGGRTTTAQQVGDMAGAVGGAGALGVGTAAVRGLGEMLNAIFRRSGYTDRVVREAATDRIAGAANIQTEVGQPVDTTALVERIMGGPRLGEAVPGVRESLADRTQNPGIAALEYGRQTGPNAGMFTQRRADNATAVESAISGLEPAGTPGALRAELEAARGVRLGEAAARTQGAQDELVRATQGLQPLMTGEGRGADIRAALEGASERARALVRQAWEPLNRTDQQVDVRPLAERFGEIDAGLSVAERRAALPSEASIPRELAGDAAPPAPTPTGLLGPDGQPIMRQVDAPAETQAIRELTGIRSQLTDRLAAARAEPGRANEARIIDQHIQALDEVMEQQIPAGLREAYDAARAARRDYGDRFERPGDAIADVLRDRPRSGYQVPDNAVARRFVQEDEGRISDFNALLREAGNDARVQRAVRDQVLEDVSRRGLLENPQALEEYLGRYRTLLGRFPELDQQLGNAAGLRRQLADAQGTETRLQADVGTPERPGSGTVGRFLRYADEQASTAMRGVLNAPEPGKAADELLRFAGDSPQAVEGARRAFWDIMEQSARRRGESTAAPDGTQPWMPNALRRFIDDPRNAAVAERLYRDNPEHLQNLRGIADALRGLDLRNGGRAPNTSGTAQGILPSAETISSRVFAFQRGQVGPTFLITSMGALMARRLTRGARAEAIERVLDDALLNPETAAVLLRENNPANRAALARASRAYLGNEASTLVNMLSDDEAPSEERRAIERGR
jgi:hypothetical protein